MRTSNANSAPRGDFVSTLATGLEVLQQFTPARPELGVGEIARLRGWDQRRTQRLVSTLLTMGALEQDESTRRYRPGVAVIDLGLTMLAGLEVRRCAGPVMEDLLVRHGHSVNLAMRSGCDALMVHCLRGSRDALGFRVNVGDRRPIHLSSLGKAILAGLEAEQLDPLLESVDYRAGSQLAVSSREELERQIAEVRSRGFAVMDQETTLGVRSLAVAIKGPDGPVRAAMNIAVPSPLMSLRELEDHVAPTLMLGADLVSARLAECPTSSRQPVAG